jgi:calcineurin-like phosphoesterase
VQTADECILPNGTGYITDVGMTGAFDSVIGVKKHASIDYFLKQTPQRFDSAKKDRRLNAIFVEIDDVSGKTTKIERIERRIPDDENGNSDY